MFYSLSSPYQVKKSKFLFFKRQKKIFKLFRASEVLPVVLAPNCYAKDKLQGIEALNAKSDGNAAAVRFGFVRIGLSSPDGAWTFGKLLYSSYQMYCSIKYKKKKNSKCPY